MSAARCVQRDLRLLLALTLAIAGCTTPLPMGDEQPARIAILAFSQEGGRLALARQGANAVLLLDAGTLAQQREFRGRAPTAVRAVSFSRNGARLAATGLDDTVVVWDLASGRELFRRDELKGARAAALSPDGTLVAVAGPGHDASLWIIEDQRELVKLKGHFEDVLAIAFSQRGDLIATGGEDRTVRLWRLDQPSPVTLPHWHRAAVTEVVFSPDGALLAAAGADLALWRVDERRLIGHALEPPPTPTLSPAAEDALRMLMMAIASAGMMRGGGAPVYIGPGGMSTQLQAAAPLQVAFSPDGRFFAVVRRQQTASDQHEVVVAEVSGTRVTKFNCDCSAIAFLPNGRAIATGGSELRFRSPDDGAIVDPDRLRGDIVAPEIGTRAAAFPRTIGRDRSPREERPHTSIGTSASQFGGVGIRPKAALRDHAPGINSAALRFVTAARATHPNSGP